MPHNHEWQSRIKAVEREYVAMRQAANWLLEAALANPTILLENLRRREIVRASHNLEGTYVVRLFAEFEAGARQYWETNWSTYPKAADLLDGLAARCGIPDTQRDHVHLNDLARSWECGTPQRAFPTDVCVPRIVQGHLVRDYRNGLVHERDNQAEAVPVAVARGYLCQFFSFLPPQW